MSNLYSQILEELAHIPVVDCHEHLLPPGWTADPQSPQFEIIRPMRAEETIGLPYILNNSYCGWERAEMVEANWESLGSFLRRVRGRGFYRSLLGGLQALYGFGQVEISEDTWRDLSQRISQAHADASWPSQVLQQQAGIELILWDHFWSMSRPITTYGFLQSLFRVDPLLIGCSPDAVTSVGTSPFAYAAHLGCPIRSFDDYLTFVADALEGAAEQGAAGLKCAAAYERSLEFAPTRRAEAEAAFNCPDEFLTPHARKVFGDYIMQFIVEQAVKLNLSIQIHVGLARIETSHPLHISSLLQRYPKARFVLLHGGYPWLSETCALAFTYHNVALDLVWLPLLSPYRAQQVLHEWIDLVDSDRLLWGGDCWTPEEVYGAVRTGREVIAGTLAEKVTRGELSEPTALELGRRVLHDNARCWYQLKDVHTSTPR